MNYWRGLVLIVAGMASSALSTLFSLRAYDMQWMLIRSLVEDGMQYDFDTSLLDSSGWILFLASMALILTTIGTLVLYTETRQVGTTRA